MRVQVRNARLGFAHQLFTPSAVEEGKPLKYGCDAILVPGSSVWSRPDDTSPWVQTTMPAVLLAVADLAMKGKGKAWMDSLENSKKCYRNGDLRVNKAGDVYEGYEGMWYVTSKSNGRPNILDANKTPLTIADGRPYSGCFAVVSLDVYGIVDAKKKGLHGGLRGVQFARHGDPFAGGGVASDDEFDDLSVTPETADDLA